MTTTAVVPGLGRGATLMNPLVVDDAAPHAEGNPIATVQPGEAATGISGIAVEIAVGIEINYCCVVEVLKYFPVALLDN